MSGTWKAVGMVVAFVLGACAPAAEVASGPVVIQPGTPGSASTVRGADDLRLESPAHTADDVHFMHMMIPHHQQALDMAALVPDRTDNEAIQLMARRIQLSQDDEIRLIRSWLEQRGEPVEPPMSHASMPMHGMLSGEEMARLEAASGTEFDRLFLQYMIRHHQGAVTMVEELFASEGGGQEPEIFQFATGVGSDQPIEISRMRRMLAELPR